MKKRKKQKNKNAIEEVQFDELEPEKDTYIFLLGCNNDFPTIYKDENYLPDKVLRSINEDTTTEKNKLSKTIALEKIKSRIHNGAIILLHSTSKTNADILDTIITDLKSSGYTFKNLDELAK